MLREARRAPRLAPVLGLAVALLVAGCEAWRSGDLNAAPEAAPSADPGVSPRRAAAAEVATEEPTEELSLHAPAFRCEVPALPIPRPRACGRGRAYPRCKWLMPPAPSAAGRYRRWRNTIPEHWWARESTVRFVLAVADAFHEAHPDQVLAVGDLDAPGPRHQTHDRGVDVDLYLPGALLVENVGGGRTPHNYEGKSPAEVATLRDRVETLAKILATCSQGAVRIYYNDEVVRERFLAWYARQAFPANPFAEGPMVTHNRLHDFHFHVSVPENLAPLPFAPGGDTLAHPEASILAAPPPESAPHLSSRTRRAPPAEAAPPETAPAE